MKRNVEGKEKEGKENEENTTVSTEKEMQSGENLSQKKGGGEQRMEMGGRRA